MYAYFLKFVCRKLIKWEQKGIFKVKYCCSPDWFYFKFTIKELKFTM